MEGKHFRIQAITFVFEDRVLVYAGFGCNNIMSAQAVGPAKGLFQRTGVFDVFGKMSAVGFRYGDGSLRLGKTKAAGAEQEQKELFGVGHIRTFFLEAGITGDRDGLPSRYIILFIIAGDHGYKKDEQTQRPGPDAEPEAGAQVVPDEKKIASRDGKPGKQERVERRTACAILTGFTYT